MVTDRTWSNTSTVKQWTTSKTYYSNEKPTEYQMIRIQVKQNKLLLNNMNKKEKDFY